MKISRRDFLKWSAATAVALNLELDMGKVNTVLAAEIDPSVI
ncbi:protein exported by TAT pathway [Clostridium pasteurianum BC1]|uniref:Protein exported by TAT pathway n=1 Tax=Clostridium pasteurianum BC1 TaxID=86416 RepID=R4JXY6_CLOPA|nr:protein exported by TAT pathway [Clostridium pasteurianum BC1]